MSISTKRCTKCGELKSIREFHRNRSTPDGYHGNCKKCRARQEGFRYIEPLPCVPAGYRYCKACQQTYPLTDEYFQLGTHSGRYYCKRCVQESKRIWAERNRNHVHNYFQQYRQSHRERDQENARHYRENNRDKIRATNRKYYHAHKHEYQQARRMRSARYPYLRVAEKQRRRARQQALPCGFTRDDWRKCLDYWDNRCAACGRPKGLWHTIAADHWIPLSNPDCPGTIPTNIIPLCHGVDGCNNSKASHDPTQWLIDHFGKRKAQDILARVEAYFTWIKEPNSHE